MQLKLLPPAPHPTVLFTLAYPAPPPSLPLPLAYAHALRTLVDERLMDADDGAGGAGLGLAGALAPVGSGSLTPHALDRATWLGAVLAEVVFDLSAGERSRHSEHGGEGEEEEGAVHVEATYVDGRVVRLALPACAGALRAVLADVAASAAAAEAERAAREARHAYHARAMVTEGERHPRGVSFDVPRPRMEEFGVGRASVEGYVETRRGKGRRAREREREREAVAALVRAEEAQEPEKREEREREGKGKSRHRKKPSLLMSLVAFASSITSRRTPPSSPTTSGHVVPPLFVPEQATPEPHVVVPQIALPPPEPAMSAADLRRRARATLVDVFRRHVLAALHEPPPVRLVSSSQSTASLDAVSLAVQCVSLSPSARGLALDTHFTFADDESTDSADSTADGDEERFGAANEGGYVAWVTRSLLARVDAELRAMRARAGRRGVGRRLGLSPVAPLADEAPPFGFDDSFGTERGYREGERDGETSSTATTESDGSSVHTPSEGTSLDQALVLAPCTPPSEQSPYFPDGQERDEEEAGGSAYTPPRRPPLTKQPPLRVPRSPSPPFRPSLSVSRTPSPPPAPFASFAALCAERARLRGLLVRLAAQHSAVQVDDAQLLAVLETRSRRRAWSNRALLGRAESRHSALSIPLRRSPLATCTPVTAASLSVVPAALEGPRGLVVTTVESDVLRLFPVCEDDEEPARWDFAPLTRQPTRRSVPVRPRARTRSISAAPASYPGYVAARDVPAAVRAMRSTDDLPGAFDPQTKVELFDVYADDEDEDEDEEAVGAGAEFTLAMDLPAAQAGW